jgi:hypothetical protein
MPTEQRLGLHEEPTPANLRHQPAQPGEDRTVGWPRCRAIDLAAQDRQFMAQHDDLDRQLVAIVPRSRNSWSIRTKAR